jgi:DNA polymerase-3 subunit epsilon
MLLVFDTETDSLVNKRIPADHPGQPRLVQLAAVLTSDAGDRELGTLALIVRPEEGIEIPKAASDIHGITTELARAVGVPLVVALAAFSHLAKASDRHVAHNVSFDMTVMAAAFARAGRPLPPLNPICTKELAEPITRLPPTARMIATGFGNKFKAPTLGECVRHLFDEELTGAHDALVDVRACLRVYLELTRRAALTIAAAATAAV